MTGPGQPPGYGDQWQQQGGWQYGQPPQQGGWQYGQPPQQGGWQYGQPPQQGGWQYGQPPQQAGWPSMYPHQGQGGYAPQPGTPQQPRHRGKRWIVVAVVVAVLAVLGVGGTWFAVSQLGSSGADSPTAAAETLVSSVEDGDLIGALETLPPAEAELVVDTVKGYTAELGRLGLFESGTDAESLGDSVQVELSNAAFDESAQEKINDHLTIVPMTAGKLTFTADPQKLPFTDEMFDAMADGRSKAEADTATSTVDAAELRRDGTPIRVATVKVDGGWHPSMMYTLADYALRSSGKSWPEEPIPARGTDSPEAAVKEFVKAGISQDVTRIVELLPPDTMGAYHDVGPALLDMVNTTRAPNVTILDIGTETSDAQAGTRVELDSLKLRAPSGIAFTIRRDGSCYRVEARQEQQRVCADEFLGQTGLLEELGANRAAVNVLRDVFRGVFERGVGVITTEVDDKHYVAPVRTMNDTLLGMSESLDPADIKELIE